MQNNSATSRVSISGQVRKRITGLSSVARTLALPHENRPVRLPTYPNLERTALVSVEHNSTTNSSLYGDFRRRYMLCRDAGSPFWRDERYDAPAAGGPPGIAYATGTVTALNPLDYAPATWESTTPLAPVGIEAEAPVWAWVPRNQSDSISFYVAAGNAVGSLDVQFEVLHPNGTIDNITMIGVGYSGDGVKQLPVSDVWVKISSIKVLAGPTTLILYNSPGRFLMPVFAPLESTVSTAPYDSCRANAVSLLLTNVSRVQIKQGLSLIHI